MESFTVSALISNRASQSSRRIEKRNRRRRIYIISAFGENTEEWQVGKLNLSEKKEGLSNQVELSFGFGELGAILNNVEEDKIWKANQELIRRESVESQLRTIREETEKDFRTAISGDLENSGGQSSLLEQKEANIGENVLGGR